METIVLLKDIPHPDPHAAVAVVFPGSNSANRLIQHDRCDQNGQEDGNHNRGNKPGKHHRPHVCRRELKSLSAIGA